MYRRRRKTNACRNVVVDTRARRATRVYIRVSFT
jgi:hypothetical protein